MQKTKTIINKQSKEMQRISSLRGIAIKKVKSFCYICYHIKQGNKYTTKIKRRIALVKQVFIKKQNLLTSRCL